MLNRILLFLIAWIFTVVLSACDKEEPVKKKVLRPVKTMIVQKSEGTITRYFPGRVLASEEVILSFLVSGQLKKLPILEGQQVKKETILAKLDPIQYQEAFNEAKAKFERSKAHYLRAKELVKQKYLSEADYDDRRSRYLTNMSRMNRAKKDLDDTVLRAPFDGVISRKYVDNYEHVKEKQKIFKLQDLDHVDIEINVPENVMVNLREDASNRKPLTVIFDSLPKRTYTSTFKEYSAEADPETQTYRVVLIMPSPKEVSILPGMTATVRATLPDFKSGGAGFMVVPSGAVLSKNKQTFVWVVDPQSMTVKKRTVTVSRMVNNEIHVVSGLKVGERIATAGVHYLQEGQKISLLEESVPKP